MSTYFVKEKNSLPLKIRFFRERCGMSQRELEEVGRFGKGLISKIESGKRNPSKETLFRIAEVLVLNVKETAYLFDINLYISFENVGRTNNLE